MLEEMKAQHAWPEAKVGLELTKTWSWSVFLSLGRGVSHPARRTRHATRRLGAARSVASFQPRQLETVKLMQVTKQKNTESSLPVRCGGGCNKPHMSYRT